MIYRNFPVIYEASQKNMNFCQEEVPLFKKYIAKFYKEKSFRVNNYAQIVTI